MATTYSQADIFLGSGTKFPPFGGAAQGAFNNAGAGPGNFKSFGGLFPPK